MPTEKPQKLILPETIHPAESKKLRQDTETQQAELRRQLREADKQCRESDRPRKRGTERATIEAGAVGLDGAHCAMKMIRSDESYVGVAALKISRILPLELFAHSSELAWVNGMPCATIEHYRRQWLTFAGTLANLTVPLDILYVIRSSGVACKTERPISILFAVLVRARTESLLAERCQESFAMLSQVIASSLHDVDVVPADGEDLDQLVQILNGETVEFCRRLADLPGRRAEQDAENTASAGLPPGEPEPEVATIVSWRPPEDSWDRLLSVLSMQAGPAAMVVHARVMPVAPLRLRNQARAGLEAMEQATEEEPSFMQTAAPIPRRTAVPILEAASQKLLSLGGPLIAARVFAAAVSPPSPVLLATIGTSLHAVDAASNPLPGGIRMKRTANSEVLARLSEPEYSQFFSPEEAIAFLRTPIPVSDGKWIDVVDICTTPLRGRSGDDAPLGVNAAHRRRVLVRMDRRTRFEHTYVVGQTGTGKSTFLLHQIMHDIGQGCGVGVLDPHGTLIEDVLRRMPAERADDVVILDPTDVARPVPFNPLAITENDPLEYRQVRALVINDLYADVEHAYAAQWGNISGPVFESHLRGILGLLLGMDPQRLPWVPNLSVMRAVYYNSPLRKLLLQRLNGRDQIVDDFLREAEAATGDFSMRNQSGYVTSKFNRFLSDHAMRNVICQNRSINLREIVAGRKILLCNLGRGRFGEHSAKLLASALLSRLRHAVMARGGDPSAPPFYLFADECQLFADGRLAALLAEARKFGLALTLAHQYLDQLPADVLQAVLGNVGTLVALRVSPADADRLATLFAPTFSRRALVSLPNFHAVARSHGCLGTAPFTLEIEPPVAVPNPERAKLLRQIARLRYGRDRREVEEEIAETYRTYTSVE
jgi:hypothetical protein